MQYSNLRKKLKRSWIFYCLYIVAVGLSIFQIWQVLTARLGANVFRPIHLTWILALVFLHYPLVSKEHTYNKYYKCLDIIFTLLSIVAGIVILSFDYNDFRYIRYGLSTLYFTVGGIFFLLLLEATRRSVGTIMMLIAVLFVAYNLLGHYFSGKFSIKAFSMSEFLSFQIFSTHGIFGLPLGIAAEVVFVFVLFGALLEVTKAGDFFTNISFAITGRFRGGPAKASVIASALLGSISGSAIANAVTTGTFTIPLMKKIGYKGEQAAGIEASASTGGQIMPPIMGAGAFIMAQFTGVSYKTIVLLCFMPALLYFLSTLLYVHIMACKLEIKKENNAINRQKLLNILKSGGHSFISVIVVLILLLFGFTPALVGILGCGSVVLISFVRSHTRINLKGFFIGLKKGAILAIPVSVACATAGIIVGVVGQTGLGLQMTNFILSLSSGHLFSVFLFTALMALILGMGLPVTASYILLSIVAVPVFIDFGVPLIAAHIIVFWLSQTSNVTPPIALAAFAASGIAKSNPMKSALQAFKLSSGLLLIPLMMLYTDLLYTDGVNIGQNILATVFTIVAMLGLALIVEGMLLFRRVGVMIRLVSVAAVGMLIFFDGTIQFLGGIWIVFVEVYNMMVHKKSLS